MLPPEIQPDGPADIWAQWPGETRGKFEHFCAFLAMPAGQRDIRKLAVDRGLVYSTIHKYSKASKGRPSWHRRAKHWDFHVAARVEDRVVETRAEIIQAHARLWADVREMAVLSIRARLDAGEALPIDLALRYAEAASKNERLALGELTSRAGVDLSRATDKQLAALEGLLARTS